MRMYRGITKDGKRAKGWLVVDIHKRHYLLTPLPDRGDPDFGGLMQYFDYYLVIPKTVSQSIVMFMMKYMIYSLRKGLEI